MRIQDLIIGLMIFAAVGLTVFSFTAQLYDSEQGLNVSFDAYTQSKFDSFKGNLSSTDAQIKSTNDVLKSYAPGQGNQTLENAELSAAGLATAAWKSVMQIPSVLSIFSSMIGTIGSAIGIDANITGFIIGAILISLILTIIGISFYREVL